MQEKTQEEKIAHCKVETLKHIQLVRENLLAMMDDLESRLQHHDDSKLVEPELSIFAEFTPLLKETEYDSDEYRKLLEKVKPALDNHYAKNRHHPEFVEKAEIWKEVGEYEGLYWISDLGRVKNKKQEILNPPMTPKGYLRVQLFKNGTKRNFMVHRLVAEAFLLNSESKEQVNHKNSIRHDNRVENLEWATPSENQQHAYDFGNKEPVTKHIVKCIDLDIVTEGTYRMEEKLHELGYEKANAGSIWACINGVNKTCCGLKFEGYAIQEFGTISFLHRMTLVDLVEMLCDWVAASNRNKNGDPFNSVRLNSKRFNIDPQLSIILENTVREYFRENQ